MVQTKNALNNLIARYKSVLAHCKVINTGILVCALTAGASASLYLSNDAWAEDVTVRSDETLNVNGTSRPIDGKLTNDGKVYITNWNGTGTPGYITANDVLNNGLFYVFSSELTTSNSLTSSGTFELHNATLSVTGNINNSGSFLLNQDTGNILNATSLQNNDNGIFKINNGTIDIATITNSDNAQFIYHGGTLTTDKIINTSTYYKDNGDGTYDGGFTVNKDIEGKLTSIENGTGAYFGINNSSMTTTSLVNSGTFIINSYDADGNNKPNEHATITITNLTNNKDANLIVNGSWIQDNHTHLIVNTSTINSGTFQVNSAGNVIFEKDLANFGVLSANNAHTTLQIKGNLISGTADDTSIADVNIAHGASILVDGHFHNVEGTVDVYDSNTMLHVQGDFINGTETTEGTLHIHDEASTVVHNLTNENGIIGIHSGSLIINGILTNNSTSVSNANDGIHTEPEEAIHVHDAELKAETLLLNDGALGLHHGGDAIFTDAYAKKNSTINIHDGGSFTADKGLLAGVLNIEENGIFIKKGKDVDVLTISNKINNKGTIHVSGGGLALENLVNDSTTSNDFFTDGDVIVSGDNSYLRLGEMSPEALHALLGAGLAEADHHDGSHSNFTMLQPAVTFNDGMGIVLRNGSDLIVSKTQNAGTGNTTSTVKFNSGTLFKFNGHGFNREDAVITVDGVLANAGSVDIASDAKFLATNLTAKTYYTLIKNVTASTESTLDKTGWWTSVNTGSIDRMLENAKIVYVAENDDTYGNSDTNDIVIVSGGVTDKNFGVDEEIFENMKDLWEDGHNNKDSENAGTGFVSDAADKTQIPDDAEAGKTLESALNVAVTGGIAGMTTDASDIASQAVNHRIDGVRAEAGDYYEDISATDWGLWAIPLYQQSQVRDMKIGVNSGGYDSYITGAIIGLDRKKDEWTCGIAFGLGFGEAESVGNYASTKTQLDFWSAILYGGYHKGNFELKGDFTYTQTRSEIHQDNPYHLVSKANISADVDSQLYSLGATVSYRMEGDDIDMTPHIGVRYRAYHQDSFTSTLGGQDLFRVHDGNMETWLMPVGVTLSDTFLYNEWLITPRLDVSFTAVFGDTTIMNRVGFAGSGDGVDSFGTASIEADVLDYGFASLSLGVGAKKDDWSFGLDFDFQKSHRREAQAVFARAAYRF